jgi:hypothetical protein
MRCPLNFEKKYMHYYCNVWTTSASFSFTLFVNHVWHGFFDRGYGGLRPASLAWFSLTPN